MDKFRPEFPISDLFSNHSYFHTFFQGLVYFHFRIGKIPHFPNFIFKIYQHKIVRLKLADFSPQHPPVGTRPSFFNGKSQIALTRDPAKNTPPHPLVDSGHMQSNSQNRNDQDSQTGSEKHAIAISPLGSADSQKPRYQGKNGK